MRRLRFESILRPAGLIIAAVALVLAVMHWGPALWSVLKDPERTRAVVQNQGRWAWLSMIVLQAVQVIVAPLPGNVAAIGSGYIFGFGLGFLLCRIGVIIGSIGAFLLGRLFGRRLLRLFVREELMNRFDAFVVRQGPFYLFLLMFIPNPTGDWLYYLAGATAIPLPVFALLTLIGRAPSNLIECYIGAQMYRLGTSGHHLTWWQWLILIAALAPVVVIYYLNRQRLERFFARFTKFD